MNATGHLPRHVKTKEVPTPLRILRIDVSSEVVGIEVTNIFQFRDTISIVGGNVAFESLPDAAFPFAFRTFIVAGYVRSFGVRVQGSPNAYGPETHPMRGIEP
jgi:hypothetical protein